MGHWTLSDFIKAFLYVTSPFIIMAIGYQSQRIPKKEFPENWSKKKWLIEKGKGFLIGLGSVFIPIIILGVSDYFYTSLLGEVVGTEETGKYYKNSGLATICFLLLSIPSLLFFILEYDKTYRGTHNRNLLIAIVVVCFLINTHFLLFLTSLSNWLN